MAAKQAKQARIDHITVLMTAPGHTASKRFVKTAAGIQKIDFNAGFRFKVLEPLPVTDIVSLHEALTAIESFPNMLVIRGAPLNGSHVGGWIRRLGDGGEGSNFATPSVGRRWVLIDFDKIPQRKGLSLKKDPVAVCNWLVSLLPPEFHDVAYHWQLSSSAGVFGASTVSAHTWFWLGHPVPDLQLKTWAKAVNKQAGQKLVDEALFQHVQAHYTAAPTFDGMADPFPVRSGLVSKALASVNLVLPTVTETTTRRAHTASSALSEATGFEAKLALIGDHPGGEGLHGPIVAAVASYVATHGSDGTDEEALYEAVSQRVLSADASQHDAAYVEKMASREHIGSAIQSAIRKFGAAPRKSTLHADCAPHYDSAPIPVEEITRRLEDLAKLAG